MSVEPVNQINPNAGDFVNQFQTNFAKINLNDYYVRFKGWTGNFELERKSAVPWYKFLPFFGDRSTKEYKAETVFSALKTKFDKAEKPLAGYAVEVLNSSIRAYNSLVETIAAKKFQKKWYQFWKDKEEVEAKRKDFVARSIIVLLTAKPDDVAQHIIKKTLPETVPPQAAIPVSPNLSSGITQLQNDIAREKAKIKDQRPIEAQIKSQFLDYLASEVNNLEKVYFPTSNLAQPPKVDFNKLSGQLKVLKTAFDEVFSAGFSKLLQQFDNFAERLARLRTANDDANLNDATVGSTVETIQDQLQKMESNLPWKDGIQSVRNALNGNIAKLNELMVQPKEELKKEKPGALDIHFQRWETLLEAWKGVWTTERGKDIPTTCFTYNMLSNYLEFRRTKNEAISWEEMRFLRALFAHFDPVLFNIDEAMIGPLARSRLSDDKSLASDVIALHTNLATLFPIPPLQNKPLFVSAVSTPFKDFTRDNWNTFEACIKDMDRINTLLSGNLLYQALPLQEQNALKDYKENFVRALELNKKLAQAS